MMKNDGKTSDIAKIAPVAKKKPDFTDEQKKAINTDGKVLVSASAGSGKTTTMVEKILRSIEGEVPLGKMLILVYNEAAAQELRDKLQSALFDAACTASGGQRAIFRDALDALAAAHIGTIHSFCFSLIKSNFEKLGVSPACEVLSEGEAKRYEAQAMDDVFAERHAARDEIFGQLADVLIRSRREDELRKVVEKVRAVIAIQPDRKEFADKLRTSFDNALGGEYAQKMLAFFRRDSARVRAGLELASSLFSDAGYLRWSVKCDRLAAMCREAESADFEGVSGIASRIDDVAGLECEKSISSKRMDPCDKDFGKDAVKQAIKLFSEWRDLFGDTWKVRTMHAQNTLYARKLVDLAEMTEEAAAVMKRADGVMSYEDLEFYAAELVRSGEFAGSFERVFVDEYQDVNPVQDFIIRGVSGDNVFMVGDVKQSIYGFRLSDPEIFLGRKRRYEETGEGTALEFNANFRSVNAVLDFVNCVFDEVMTEASSGVDYAKEGHFVIGKDKQDASGEKLEGCAEVHVFPYAGTSSAPGIDAEADFIRDKIYELCGRAKKEDGTPIGYGDCTILVRGRNASVKKLAAYIGEFLPLDTSIFAEQSSRAEEELIGFLTVLDNPRQDIPLAGFMLSYFGGFDEDELARIAALRGEGDLYDAVLAAAKKKDALGKKTAALLDMLSAYRLKASFKSVPELLQGIVSDFDYAAFVAGMGEGSADDVLSFVSASAGGDANAGISRFLASYAEKTKEAKRARPQGGDKVRIATFHSFKGLESPVVFVCCPGGGRDGRAEGDVIVENKGSMGLRHFDFEGRKKDDTLSLAVTERIRAERERLEEMRLYYVALTRAKQYLYITAVLSRTPAARFGHYPALSEPALLSDLLSELKRKGKIGVVMHDERELAWKPSAPEKLTPPRKADARNVKMVKKAAAFVYPHKEASELAMKYSVSALDGGADDLALSVFADRADEGIAYHKVMEHIEFAAEGREGAERELDAMLAAGLITPAEREQVDAEAVARCLASPVMRLARESTCYRERSFLMYVPADEVGQGTSRDKVLVQGVIDLFIDGKERVIVDFKNSALRSDEALRKYKKQLQLYKKAVESSFSGKVDRILLYSFKTGKTLDVERDIEFPRF